MAGPPTPASTPPAPAPTPASTWALRPEIDSEVAGISRAAPKPTIATSPTRIYTNVVFKKVPTQLASGVEITAGIAIQPTLDHSISRHIEGTINNEAMVASTIVIIMPW